MNSYQKALALRERLLHEHSGNPEYRLARANLYLTLTHTAGPQAGEACGWLVKAQRAFAQMRDQAGLTGAAADGAAAADREAARCAG